jgi:ADP-ribosyl-[dinitrogen reductase] hydrolase
MNILERYRGSLLGLAVGDALGATLEFEEPGTFEPIEEIEGGGPFSLAAGQWTDDTSMALCLAESLITTETFDPADQMARYLRWYLSGHMSSTGRCFDIGNTVRHALHEFQRTGEPFSGRADAMSAGNGSIMRLAPVPLRWVGSPFEAIERSGESSRTTHKTPSAIDGCRYLAALILGAVLEVEKSVLLSDRYSPVPDLWAQKPLVKEIEDIARGSFKERQPPKIKSTGYVVDTLEAALWAFYHGDSFEQGCRLAVNLGGDADTCGAVYGQLAGAFYGEYGIPQRWREVLSQRSLIESLADRLFELAGREATASPIAQ